MSETQITESDVRRNVALDMLEVIATTTYNNNKFEHLDCHIAKAVWRQGENLAMVENQKSVEEKNILSINYE